jgi:hypothetical protein
MSPAAGQSLNRTSKSYLEAHECYTVELHVEAPDATRQYKVWHKATTYMSVVLEETSNLVDRLRVGDRLKIKYFETDQAVPSEYLETEILNIKKRDQGRLKGQYLLDLQIREPQH